MPTPAYGLASLSPGQRVPGPAILIDSISTVVVEPGWTALVTGDGNVRMDRDEASPGDGDGAADGAADGARASDSEAGGGGGVECDPIQLAIFSHRCAPRLRCVSRAPRTPLPLAPPLPSRNAGPSARGARFARTGLLSSTRRCHRTLLCFERARAQPPRPAPTPLKRFMGIAEQMGRVLQRTSVSVNIKERLDFSCALFGPDGSLVGPGGGAPSCRRLLVSPPSLPSTFGGSPTLDSGREETLPAFGWLHSAQIAAFKCKGSQRERAPTPLPCQVANAPHLPVHLGAMSEAVRFQASTWGEGCCGGDGWVGSAPYHLQPKACHHCTAPPQALADACVGKTAGTGLKVNCPNLPIRYTQAFKTAAATQNPAGPLLRPRRSRRGGGPVIR